MDKKIKALIEISEYLFKTKVNIEDIYNKIYNYKKEEEPIELDINNLQPFFNKWKNIGTDFQIDLPYWVSPNNNKTKIMIIGQDANNDGTKNPDKVLINSPFSSHSQQPNIYNQIFNKLIKQNNVYLTDLYKLFFRKQYESEYFKTTIKSHKCNDYIYNEIHYKILQSEINIVKPDLIVAFGNKARNACSIIFRRKLNDKITKDIIRNKPYDVELKDLKTKLISVPHPAPSQYSSNLWKTFLSKNLFNEEIKANNVDKIEDIKIYGVVKLIQEIMKNHI